MLGFIQLLWLVVDIGFLLAKQRGIDPLGPCPQKICHSDFPGLHCWVPQSCAEPGTACSAPTGLLHRVLGQGGKEHRRCACPVRPAMYCLQLCLAVQCPEVTEGCQGSPQPLHPYPGSHGSVLLCFSCILSHPLSFFFFASSLLKGGSPQPHWGGSSRSKKSAVPLLRTVPFAEIRAGVQSEKGQRQQEQKKAVCL